MTDAPLRLEWQATTDLGAVRKVNEDSYTARPETGIWAVADGMGGHAQGDWASQQVIAALEAVTGAEDFDALLNAAARAIHDANARVCAHAAETGQRMGTTVVVLAVHGRQFGVLWAGDSRVYVVRGGELLQLTRDHTIVQDMLDRGLVTQEEARDHPMGHVLARAIGVEERLELDAVADEMLPGDIFLLCSDGVYGTLAPEELLAMLTQVEIERAPQAIIDRCLERHVSDNVTAIVVRAQEPTRLILAPLLVASP